MTCLTWKSVEVGRGVKFTWTGPGLNTATLRICVCSATAMFSRSSSFQTNTLSHAQCFRSYIHDAVLLWHKDLPSTGNRSHVPQRKRGSAQKVVSRRGVGKTWRLVGVSVFVIHIVVVSVDFHTNGTPPPPNTPAARIFFDYSPIRCLLARAGGGKLQRRFPSSGSLLHRRRS